VSMKVPVGVKGIVPFDVELPPQPTTATMISASAKTAAAGYLRKNVSRLVKTKMNSEQAASNTRNLSAADAGMDLAVAVVCGDGPEPVPRPPFERPTSKLISENLRAAGGGVVVGSV
jgi:hypothetical protein